MRSDLGWNYGDILDAVGDVVPADKPCLVHGERVISWGDFNRRTNNLARQLMNRGARVGDKVAFYMRNGSAYSETLGACFKSRLVHVNVNYRYVDEELWYILDNSDSKIVVYDAEFAGQVAALRRRLPNVALWVEVADGETHRADFAVRLEDLMEIGDGNPLKLERSGEDLLLLYTGGTTGMPKGVM